MGIATSVSHFTATERPGVAPNRWLIRITNGSNFATTFIPLSVMVESEHMALDGLGLFTQGDPHLNPGASIEYELHLKREGFDELEGWSPEELEPGEKLTLILNHLGAGAQTAPSILELTLPVIPEPVAEDQPQWP